MTSVTLQTQRKNIWPLFPDHASQEPQCHFILSCNSVPLKQAILSHINPAIFKLHAFIRTSDNGTHACVSFSMVLNETYGSLMSFDRRKEERKEGRELWHL